MERLPDEAADFEFERRRVHDGFAVMTHGKNLIVRRDPAGEVFPLQHFSRRLFVEKRNEHAGFFLCPRSKCRPWTLRKRDDREGDTAAHHIPTAQ